MAFHGQNRPPHPKKGKENYMNDNNTKEQVRDRKTDTVDPRPDTQRTTRKTYDPPLYAARRWNERGHDELFFDSYAEEGVDGRVAITPIPNNATNMIDKKYEDLVAENLSLLLSLEEKEKHCQELREENLKLKGRLWEALKIKI
jgi:hypothetical protein